MRYDVGVATCTGMRAMTDTARARIEATVPFAVTRPDRIDARRYYDPGFYALEREKLWPHVWQMACRLQEIEKPGDFAVYEIFDQSVIVVRVDEQTVKAFHNHCRHRGVKLVQDRGCAADGFTCPFHGWRWRSNGECKFVYTPTLFEPDQLRRSDLALRPCRVETWGGCAFINFDDNAPPLRQSLGKFVDIHDAWHVESLKVEWWYAARLPVNWKLAMEAFMEGYHVMATHPQLVPGDPTKPETIAYMALGPELSPMSPYITMPTTPMPDKIASKEFIDMNIYFMKLLNEGMAGMTHVKDVRTAEALVETQLPEDFAGATIAWRKKLNEAVMTEHRRQGMDIGELNEIDAKEYATSVNFAFPHYFLLPTYGSASSYRIRPLGPEECLFELWSLTRFPDGETPPPIKTPEPWAPDDPRWPPIPTQDFSNLPRQQLGLHTKGFEFMRLSNKAEGLISNYQRLIDGYLAGIEPPKLLDAVQKVSGCIDVPCKELGF
jgi:phenylpropionate dioxygenase-like ring-hydroxylating dioxygenase large terminal subunit